MTPAPLPEPHWYAVMVRPRMEAKAAERLTGLGYKAFCPMERVRLLQTVRGSHHKRPKVVQRALYSRYIFVGLWYAGQGLYEAAKCNLVSTVVYFAGEPLAVPQAVIEAMMEADEARAKKGALKDEVSRKPFLAGQAARVRSGHACADFVVEVSRDSGKKVRAWLEMLGTRREVEFKPGDLEVV